MNLLLQTEQLRDKLQKLYSFLITIRGDRVHQNFNITRFQNLISSSQERVNGLLRSYLNIQALRSHKIFSGA